MEKYIKIILVNKVSTKKKINKLWTKKLTNENNKLFHIIL